MQLKISRTTILVMAVFFVLHGDECQTNLVLLPSKKFYLDERCERLYPLQLYGVSFVRIPLANVNVLIVVYAYIMAMIKNWFVLHDKL